MLNGIKQFITNGKRAESRSSSRVTDQAAGKKGISAFIVPTDTPGYNVARLEDKLGISAPPTPRRSSSRTARSRRRTCSATKARGYRSRLSNLEGGRIGIAAQSLGMARAAFEAALAYAQERTQFGKPIFEHQAIAFSSPTWHTQLDAARLLILHAARLRDAGLPCLTEASHGEAVRLRDGRVGLLRAIQIHGGYGYLHDFPSSAIYRDARICQIYEGTSEIQRLVIARDLAG